MFSLGDGTKFWLYSKPTDMRKNFNMLSGIVNNCMQQNLYSGDVFVFVNASNNMLKLLRYEPGGLVIYNKRLDHGRMHLVERVQEGDSSPINWKNGLPSRTMDASTHIRSIRNSPGSRALPMPSVTGNGVSGATTSS